jgi:glycosyltransferase involved in cell wall biosynthesis
MNLAHSQLNLTSPLKVGLDVSALNPNFKSHAARGIGRYVRELKRSLTELSVGTVSVGEFEHDQIISQSRLKPILDWAPFGRTTLRQQIIYPLQLSNKNTCPFDIVHFPAHMDPPAWGMRNYIVTVLDLIPLVMSDLYKAINPSWRFKLARHLELQAIKNAALVVAISDHTARDCERLLGINPENIVVTPLGVDKKFFVSGEALPDVQVLNKLGIPSNREIVLYLGGIDPRKNVPTLIKAFRHIRDSRSGKPILVIAGKIADDKQYPQILKAVEAEKLGADVILPGFVADEDLLKLFRHTAVFVFPSLYEGFGLTPLEAMAAGVPVVSSNTSSMPEVLGKSAILINPESAQEIAEAALGVLNNQSIASELRVAGPKRAQLFTWQRTGETTLKAYERFLR